MRIVSLVPSLTETLWDLGVGTSIVGVTKFCVHPEDARDKARVIGGTKDPDVPLIGALRPDLVIADEDENRAPDLEALRKFSSVHVARIETVDDAAREISAIGALVGRSHDAEARAETIRQHAAELCATTKTFAATRVFVPIWRRPLMTLGGRTYMSDLLACAGGSNVFASAERKYFETTVEEVRAQDVEAVLLPTEPFRYGERHRAEYAQQLGLDVGKVRVVDGQAFTWFGTRTLSGLDVLAEAVRSLHAGLKTD